MGDEDSVKNSTLGPSTTASNGRITTIDEALNALNGPWQTSPYVAAKFQLITAVT